MGKKNNRFTQSDIPGKGLAVKVLGNDKKDIEFALRLFKKKIKDSKIMNEVFDRTKFIKPSAKRRVVMQRAIQKQQSELEQN
jgi:ribosomal protein S21